MKTFKVPFNFYPNGFKNEAQHRGKLWEFYLQAHASYASGKRPSTYCTLSIKLRGEKLQGNNEIKSQPSAKKKDTRMAGWSTPLGYRLTIPSIIRTQACNKMRMKIAMGPRGLNYKPHFYRSSEKEFTCIANLIFSPFARSWSTYTGGGGGVGIWATIWAQILHFELWLRVYQQILRVLLHCVAASGYIFFQYLEPLRTLKWSIMRYFSWTGESSLSR